MNPVPLSFTERFLSVFQLIVLGLQRASLLFWFTALISIIFSTKQQTDKVSEWLVNTVEHLAAKEPDISLRRWWRPKTDQKERERVHIGLTFLQCIYRYAANGIICVLDQGA